MKDEARKATTEGESRRIVLTGELNVQRAAEIKRLLEHALDGSTNMTIVFEEVSDVDLSFLQILHAIRTSCEVLGRTLEIDGECPELVDRATDRAGLLREPCCHDSLGQHEGGAK
jgi:anti-anti-sigma regulatory factor